LGGLVVGIAAGELVAAEPGGPGKPLTVKVAAI